MCCLTPCLAPPPAPALAAGSVRTRAPARARVSREPGSDHRGRHLHKPESWEEITASQWRYFAANDVLCVRIMDKYQWTIREMARIFYSLVIIYYNYSWICYYCTLMNTQTHWKYIMTTNLLPQSESLSSTKSQLVKRPIGPGPGPDSKIPGLVSLFFE